MSGSSSDAPLSEIVVVAIDQAVAAPYCTSRLADAGGRRRHSGYHAEASYHPWSAVRNWRGMAGAGGTLHVLRRWDCFHRFCAAIRETGFAGAASIELEFPPDPKAMSAWVAEAHDKAHKLLQEAGVRKS